MLRSHRTRSCQVLTWGVVLFLGFQLLGGLALDHLCPLVRFPEARQVFDHLKTLPAPPGIVFLGSSRTQTGILPGIIEPLVEKECHLEKPLIIFNEAVPAGDPISYEMLFDHLLGQGILPEVVVIEVNPETINRRDEWLAFHWRRQLNWTHFFSHAGATFASGAGQRWFSSRFFPLFLHRDQIFQQVCRYCKGELTVASEPDKSIRRGREVARGTIDWNRFLEEPVAQVTPELKARIELSTEVQPRRWLRTYDPHGLTREALERILGRCQDLGIQAVLLSLPVTECHRNTYTPEIERQFLEAINELQRKYHLPWFDTRKWIADGLFLDNHHLNPDGSAYYSKLVAFHILPTLKKLQLHFEFTVTNP